MFGTNLYPIQQWVEGFQNNPHLDFRLVLITQIFPSLSLLIEVLSHIANNFLISSQRAKGSFE